MQQWKEQGKIRHIAFSFHDTADVLDQILTEHPEVEAVQIALNYFDWDARYIQARRCYETIRAHGRQVIAMEPVKGGMLAKAPEAAEALMRAQRSEDSIVSWALRFAAGLDGVLAVLSGMSTPEQVADNIATFQRFQPINEKEREILRQTAGLYRQSGPVGTADFTPYEAINPNGVSAGRTFWTPTTPVCSSRSPPLARRATTSPAKRPSAGCAGRTAASPVRQFWPTARMSRNWSTGRRTFSAKTAFSSTISNAMRSCPPLAEKCSVLAGAAALPLLFSAGAPVAAAGRGSVRDTERYRFPCFVRTLDRVF